jgi:branched-chain amino acid transport system ATP-binding protein
MLAVSDLHVTYGRTVAVQGATLNVTKGETVGLVGPNGAGKTTTLRTIVGLQRPRGGSIEFHGRSLVGRSPDQIARDGLVFVPAGHRVFGSMSVRDNLVLALSSQGVRGLEADQEIERVLGHFPILRDRFRGAAGKMSGGEQQQLAIARALLARPKVLLLDEPSLGLAPQFVDLVFDLIGGLRDEGVTMLLVEQNVSRTIEFCDRTYVMRSGRIELEGSREALEGRDLAEAYLGG